MNELRIDKWLWAARFFKTRGLAQTAIENGRVLVGSERPKASRNVRPGDSLLVRQTDDWREIRVLGLSDKRGPASIAQQLYVETDDSRARREAAAERRRLSPEPLRAAGEGRPTKRDRRVIERLFQDDDR
ncbi:MAG: RNA-binding S4 domain-containing protein [Burkholderiaceae bacterium]|nr:RNA-binding S4 domain-containing protein [Burkholderiaceae bacterium]